MLCKLISHDIKHSARAFLPLGAIALGAGLLTMFASALAAFLALGVAALLQIFLFVKGSLFGKLGYFYLTLPTGRGRVFAAKVVTSYIWYGFCMAIAAVILAMYWLYEPAMALRYMDAVIQLFVLAIGAIALLIFCVTLAHSTFFGRRVHGLVSGLIGFVVALAGMLAISNIQNRNLHLVYFENEWIGRDGSTHWTSLRAYQHQMGLEYGRIHFATTPWGMPVFLDLAALAIVLAISAAALFAAGYLIKRRISL